jgi:hypothetical protein
MADVITENVTKRMMDEREEIAVTRGRFRRCSYG